MTWLNIFLSSSEKALLEKACALRHWERKLDAKMLKTILSEAAQALEDAQQELARSREEAEDAVDALEALRDSHIKLPYHTAAFLSRYRSKYPKRIRA